jgi:hypothetical protein
MQKVDDLTCYMQYYQHEGFLVEVKHLLLSDSAQPP